MRARANVSCIQRIRGLNVFIIYGSFTNDVIGLGEGGGFQIMTAGDEGFCDDVIFYIFGLIFASLATKFG